jgi:outer membrane protein insertion porin family
MSIKKLIISNQAKSKFKNFKLKSILFLAIGLYANSALALEPFVIKDIRIEGIQRTEAGTVFTNLPV